MIKLKDFVDVNLTSVKPTSNEANKTVVYIYGGDSAEDKYLNASNYKALETNFDQTARDFIEQFFTLGGVSLRVIRIQLTTATSADVVKANNNLFLAKIASLKIDQVAVVLREETYSAGTYGTVGYWYGDLTVSAESGTTTINGLNILLEYIQTEVEEKGTSFRKLIIKKYAPLNATTYTLTELEALKRDTNLIWKLCTDEKDLAGVLAYLSKITLTNPNTLSDYSFTEESTCTDMLSTFNGTEDPVNWTDVKEFINVVVDLQQNGTKINLGGNTSAEFDMIQEFESIYISQKLVDKELELLRSKINILNATPLIHSTVIDVMETYYNIGYLVQTRYTGPNIYRNVNGKNICVLATDEVITGGYKVVILPRVTNSSVREFPEIELIISTNKGIRFIKTTGVVL